MSVRFLAPPLGILIGAGGGALIAQHYGWRVALLSAAAPGLILALLLSLFISEPKRGAHDAVGDSEDVPSIWVVIVRCLSWPTLRNMLFGATIAHMVSLSLYALLAAYLSRRFGHTLVAEGWLVGLVASPTAT